MITSSNGNQYLRPDYLTPLPTTFPRDAVGANYPFNDHHSFYLDAKKSPLALLAQTCSQIGADTSSKPSSDKSSKKETVREKASPATSSVSSSGSPVGGSKSGFKPYESDDKPRAKTPAKKSQQEQGSPRGSPSRKTPQQERSSSPAKASLSPYLAYPADLLRSPYLGYPAGRLKAECRDPYCAGCHLLGKACPAGCTQCEKAGLHYAQLAALAASAQPYLCSWIGSDASYCGKRFATSEELLAHLRTHTADFHPLLHRSYPTPPLSPLAAPRYHPYSKPPLLPPSLAAPPFPLPPHPGLPPYLSPYALYPRLGASHP